MDQHREHISQARDLLQLAAQTPEGRADLRGWLGQVMEALGREDGAQDGQDTPASQDGRTTWNERALARSGYAVALSAEGDEPEVIRLAEDESTGDGAHDNDGEQTMPYTEAELREAFAQDEIARLSMKAMGGPLRPEYAGLELSGPARAEELDEDTVMAATLELSARTGGRASFGDVADAAHELALNRGEAGTTAGRAFALAELAGRFPAGGEALELAARREVDRLTGQPGTDPRVADIVDRNPDLLSGQPRRGLTHTTVVEDADPTDHGAPRRGAVMHPEVERILRQAGVLLGWDQNTTIRPKSAALRAREQVRARPGHTGNRYGSWQGG